MNLTGITFILNAGSVYIAIDTVLFVHIPCRWILI